MATIQRFGKVKPRVGQVWVRHNLLWDDTLVVVGYPTLAPSAEAVGNRWLRALAGVRSGGWCHMMLDVGRNVSFLMNETWFQVSEDDSNLQPLLSRVS